MKSISDSCFVSFHFLDRRLFIRSHFISSKGKREKERTSKICEANLNQIEKEIFDRIYTYICVSVKFRVSDNY